MKGEGPQLGRRPACTGLAAHELVVFIVEFPFQFGVGCGSDRAVAEFDRERFSRVFGLAKIGGRGIDLSNGSRRYGDDAFYRFKAIAHGIPICSPQTDQLATSHRVAVGRISRAGGAEQGIGSIRAVEKLPGIGHIGCPVACGAVVEIDEIAYAKEILYRP